MEIGDLPGAFFIVLQSPGSALGMHCLTSPAGCGRSKKLTDAFILPLLCVRVC